MIDIYLSPSTQEHNSCKMGDMEENHMNKICDLMVPYLIASGITWRRNIPTMNHITSMQDSNAIGVKMHYAMHSNASNGKARGDHVFYKPFSAEGKFAATLLMEAEKAIYPLPDLCKVKLPLILYTEIYSIKAPITAIDEMFFHDTPDDAAWGHANMAALAKCKAQAICRILGKVFVDPAIPVSRAPVVPRPVIKPSVKSAVTPLVAKPFNKILVYQKLVNARKIKDDHGNALDEDGDVGVNTQSTYGKMPVIELGVACTDIIKWIQVIVGASPIDGDYGNITRSRVIVYQTGHKLSADGVVGKNSYKALVEG